MTSLDIYPCVQEYFDFSKLKQFNLQMFNSSIGDVQIYNHALTFKKNYILSSKYNYSGIEIIHNNVA